MYQLLRGLWDGAATHPRRSPRTIRGLRDGAAHPRRSPRTNDANPILIRTEMRRIHRVAILSYAGFTPFDPLSHPPQSISIHSRNDIGDTGGRDQGLVMDRLVADVGGGMGFMKLMK